MRRQQKNHNSGKSMTAVKILLLLEWLQWKTCQSVQWDDTLHTTALQ